ncbi:unnamed protein product, partial [marine sediment metagenome]
EETRIHIYQPGFFHYESFSFLVAFHSRKELVAFCILELDFYGILVLGRYILGYLGHPVLDTNQ